MYNNEQKTTLLIHEQKMKPFFLGHNYLKVVLLGSVRFTLPQQNVTTGVYLGNQFAQTLSNGFHLFARELRSLYY